MILATHGIVGSQIVQIIINPLLDDYPNADVAYSLRKLRSAYTGSAIQVRRASDNTTQNIGFVNNELDTTSLASFCSGTNGFVTTWYDQSGNGRNATQTTAANQPQIVSSGSVILENGKPAVKFDGINDRMSIPVLLINFNNFSLIGAVKANNLTASGYAFSCPDPNRLYLGRNVSNVLYFGYNDSAAKFNLGTSTNNQELLSFYAGTNANAYRNNTSSTSITSSTQSILSYDLSLGSYKRSSSFSDFYNGLIQELIAYPSDQSSNRTGISNNINSFYSIY